MPGPPPALPGDPFFRESARRGQVVVVTDSSACVGAGGDDNAGVAIIPLRVLAGGAAADDAYPAQLPEPIAAELARGERLTTARPAPEDFAAVYRLAAAAGVPAIVSVHLAAELSGTIGSARLAAASAPVPVHVVDSRTIGAGLGLVVAAASRAAAAGRPAAEVAEAATERAARTVSFFALDTQEHLRAGGRLSGGPAGRLAAAGPGTDRGTVGSLLASRPLLRIADGTITILERVRTRAAARDRLVELAAEYAATLPAAQPSADPPAPGQPEARELGPGQPEAREPAPGQPWPGEPAPGPPAPGQPEPSKAAPGHSAWGARCQLAVQHIGNPDAAAELHRQLTAAIPAAGRTAIVQASTAILAHTGPGLLGVVITPAT